MRCPFCGSHLDNDAKYCNDCGTAVDSECKGKNVNYRSYTVGRPEQTVRPAEPAYKYRQAEKLSNPVSKIQQNKPAAPSVFNNPPEQNFPFNPQNRTVRKKKGCGIAVIIIIILFSFFPVIGILLGEEEDNSDYNDNNSYYEQEWEGEEENADKENADEEFFVTEKMRGRFDGSYYLNDWVNFALKVPEEFDESSWFSLTNDMDINADYYFKNEDGDFILTGFAKGDDPFVFLNEYINSVNENMTDTNLKTEISNLGEKQVYNNDFITQSVSRDDGRTVDVYACPVDGWIFFVEVNTSSADLNNQIVDTFVHSYGNW